MRALDLAPLYALTRAYPVRCGGPSPGHPLPCHRRTAPGEARAAALEAEQPMSKTQLASLLVEANPGDADLRRERLTELPSILCRLYYAERKQKGAE
jgi:hypothetical protein